MASVPLDVIQEILPRLAVKDLLRFQCLSKFFISVIQDPEFIKLHLSHSRETNSHANSYGIFKCLEDEKNPKFTLLDLNNKSLNQISQFPLNFPLHEWQLMGACDGLVALHRERYLKEEEVALWNPFTGKYKKLDPFPNPEGYGRKSTYGLGYDSFSDDFKLLKISLSSFRVLTLVVFAVYSLKTNSWKEIDRMKTYFSEDIESWMRNGGVLVNNALHWDNIFDVSNDQRIFAFDLVKEECYPLPVLECVKSKDPIELGVLDACLTLTGDDPVHIHVWVMKEYGVAESWTKLLSCLRCEYRCSYWFERNFSTVIPLKYSRARNKILLSSCRQFFCYDLVNEKIESCLNENNGASTTRGVVKVFKGSLVALNESNDVVEEKRKQIILENDKEEKDEREERLGVQCK